MVSYPVCRPINCLIKKGVLKLTHIVGCDDDYNNPKLITEEQTIQLALGTLSHNDVQCLMYSLSDKVKVDVNIEIVA